MTPGVEVEFVHQRLGHQLQLDRRHRFGNRQPSRKVRSDDEILQLVRVRIADGRSCRGRQVEFGVVLKETRTNKHNVHSQDAQVSPVRVSQAHS